MIDRHCHGGPQSQLCLKQMLFAHQLIQRRTILPLALIILMIGAIPAAAHGFMPDRSHFENGFLHMSSAYHLMAPVIALGVAMAHWRWQANIVIAVILSGCLLAGSFASDTASDLVLEFLIPVLYLSAGIALFAGTSRWRFVVTIASVIFSFFLGLAFYQDGPADALWAWFSAGAGMTAAVMMLVAGLVWRLVQPSWQVVAGRILASWLLAVAIMLFALSVQQYREYLSLTTG